MAADRMPSAFPRLGGSPNYMVTPSPSSPVDRSENDPGARYLACAWATAGIRRTIFSGFF
jgi:hypothetical protein